MLNKPFFKFGLIKKSVAAFLLFGMILQCGCTSASNADETLSQLSSDAGQKFGAETSASNSAGKEESSTADSNHSGWEESIMNQGKPAVLSFSSFDGGGYEYTITIENQNILSFEYEKDYGGGHDELEDGASYDANLVFTGLQAGESLVTVYAQSPIMESFELLYRAVVDADLNVTLTPEATISYLMLWRAGNGNSWYFILSREQGAYYLTRDDTEEPYQIDASVGDQLYQIFDRYDVGSWNGFSGSQHAAHGEQFLLEIRLTDGTYVSAKGDFVYPDHYQDVMEQIVGILDRY